jgi:hypothetical protein
MPILSAGRNAIYLERWARVIGCAVLTQGIRKIEI